MNTILQLGIDTSKDDLVCCFKRRKQKDVEKGFDNKEAGIAGLLGYLGKDVKRTRVVIEATGNYHKAVVRALTDAGADVTVLNPARAHALAFGLGVLDKDDRVDARVLARAAQLLESKSQELRSPVHEQLRDLSRLIVTMTGENAGNKKRLGALESGSPAYIFLADLIKTYKGKIKEAKKAWLELLKQEDEIRLRYELLCSVDDIGPETARIWACECPARLDLHRVKQLCAYGAVVPRRSQSGKQKEKVSIGSCGNLFMRTGGYMAASHSVFLGGRNHEFYRKLRATGRSHNQAMVAVIHRLMREAFAVLKRGTPWMPLAEKIKEAPVSVVA